MINVQDLSYTYPGSKERTLKNISFTINKGEIFGFLGPSGAGKSTIQKIIIGILKNYIGSISVMDQEVRTMSTDFYEKIGVAFEMPNFYSKFTAIENLSFFRSMYSVETQDPLSLLSQVGLESSANKKVSDFSKGMKMRLNFCRALLNQPEMMFLDEPTSGLDPTNAKKLKDIILEEKSAGKTIIINTHNMHIAEEICDRVAFVVDGELALINSPRELKVNYGKKDVEVEYRKQQVLHKESFSLNKIGENKAFLQLLQSEEIETIHTQEATLEDIFIEVTGRSLL